MKERSSLRSPRRGRFLWLFALGVVLACMSGTRTVPVGAGSLAPQLGERSEGAAQGPFRVVAAVPQGDAAQVAEISIIFDRPLRALEVEGTPLPALTISPNLAGSWHWVGSRALLFVPQSGLLPAATEFTVEVPAKLRALDGSELPRAHRFAFNTPRPELVDATPHSGATGVLPTAALELRMNQAVRPEEMQRVGRLSAAGRPVEFSVSRPQADDRKRLRVTPRGKLPLGSEILFHVPIGLRGEEGPLPSVKPDEVTFRTYGALQVTSVDCDRTAVGQPCLPGSAVTLSFSNPVSYAAIRGALRVTPEVALRWPEWQQADSTTSYLEVPARLDAGKRYRVELAATLRDIYGQALRGGHRADVVMGDLLPRVAIGVTSGTLLPVESGPIPVAAVNVTDASVVATALSRHDVHRLATDAVELTPLVTGHPGAQRLAFPPSAARNQIVRQSFDPSTLLGSSGRGVLGFAAVLQNSADAPQAARLAKVSDLGITAKLSRQGSLVWVSRLSTAMPVAAAEVELWQVDGRRHRYVADSEGVAWIPAADFAPNLDWESADRKAVLFAASGGEWTFENVSAVVDAWALPVATDPSGQLRHEGMLYTDRGVYRPGDSVRVKGIVRRQTARGSRVPSGQRLQLSLASPEQEVLGKVDVVVSRFGTFNADLRVPSSGALGRYSLAAKIDGDEFSHGVAVEEYRPAELSVSVSASPALVHGDPLRFEARGEYLFGAGMAGAELRYSVVRSATAFRVPGNESFATDADVYYADLDAVGLAGGRVGEGAATLDAQGRFVYAEPLKLAGQRGPESLSVEVEVTDPARQTIAGSTPVLVHPAEFYLGIERGRDHFVAPGTRLRPRVLALRPDGTKARNAQVGLELIQRRWTSAREDRGGVYPELVSKVVDKVVARCAFVTNATGASCELPVQTSGYHVLRASSRDARGNPVETAVSLYALGQGEASFFGSDDGNVQLVLDKPSYKVGETAQVLVKSPFADAQALITVERAGVYRRERRRLQGSMPTFEVKVTEEFQPNAFVSVQLLRPLRRGAASIPGGASRLGYAEIRVDAAPKRLQVEVLPSTRQARPRDELTVEVKVTDFQGQARDAEVALYAVDEGVLMLTGYQTPDPLPVFTQSRALQVATLDTRRQLAAIVPRALEALLANNKGAEGGGGGDGAARRQFDQTAYFNPSLITTQGRTRASFRLPDSLTTFRIMAVVVGESELYGFGSSSVTVSKPLMARPALPRLLRAGDAAEAGVVISAKDFAPGEVTVRARLEGLKLEGPAVQRVALERNASREVRFALRAERAGTARLRFDVEGGGQRDAVEVTRPVLAPTALQAAAVYGQTTSEAAEGLGALTAVRPEVGGLEVSVASSALVGLEAALGALVDYPYGCTEQLASGLLPRVALQRLTKDFGIAAEAREPPAMGRTVGEIVARQRGDGGFGMWPETESHPWVSSYALWVLHAAKQRGAHVPERSLKSGKEYLRRMLDGDLKDPLLLASAAFAVDTLAALGDPDAGHMNRLFDRRAELPLFARGLLLHALAQSKSPERQTRTLTRELESHVRLNGNAAVVMDNLGDAYEVLMDSPVRTHAIVLRALLATASSPELLPPLARGLLAARQAGSFRTTQEGAFALLALDAYRARVEQAEPDFRAKVSLGDRVVLDQRFEGRSLASKTARLDMQALLGGRTDALRFERDGSGTLFYQARLRYAPLELPQKALDAGFYLERSMRTVQPSELSEPLRRSSAPSQRAFKGSDLVLVELLVVTPDTREYVVVDDALPAGFEAVNSELATTSRRLDVGGAGADSPCPSDGGCAGTADARGDAGVRWSPYRRELRDDRVLFFVDHMAPGMYRFRYLARATTLGRFVLPPTRAEAMYAPEVHGRTAAQHIQVQ
ncbi:MAG TPA: MG2 domain-containing protein [Polyangiaceae bacterium]|nr:MG2 domain-containing protein [Polyangiaceae bacterium]